ncbi:MAG: Ig-like domain-containing protein [Spirochaetes bacterium]|nr:Ig-like domain-containing protein [Spirochaetota bacterium]
MRKMLICFIIILILAQCAKEFPTESIIDKSPPQVIITSPGNEEFNVSKNARIRITFSEVLDSSSVNGAFIIQPPLGYQYEISGNTITIIPAGELPSGQRFWVTVKDSVKDKSENFMMQDYTFSFKVEGINYSQAQVSFRVDASAGKDFYPLLFMTGSFDPFGDHDAGWNKGKRLALYDDGAHNDGQASDGIWGRIMALSIDLAHQYTWAVDDDNNPDNGYIKSSGFFITSSAPKTMTLFLYPPQIITFHYFDIENKVSSSIYLRGEFNGWSMLDRMTGPFGSERLFTITRQIREGTYGYKYFVDDDYDKVNQDNRTLTVTYGGSTVQNDYYTGGNPVVFNYYDLENKVQGSIYLKGDFNGWSDANRMDGPYGGNRKFTTTANVKSGVSYSYKYYADNDWDKLNKNNRALTLSGGITEIHDYYAGPLTITFNYYDLEGYVNTSIHIRGDFNNWILDYPYQLAQDPVTNYKYSLTMDVDQGSYNYKYYVDGDYNKVNVNNRTVMISSTNDTTINDYYSGP